MAYQDFKVDDFLKDAFFIDWVRNESFEADQFWKDWMQKNPDRVKTLLAAKQIAISINYKSAKKLTNEEFAQILAGALKDTTPYARRRRLVKQQHWIRQLVASVLLLLTIGTVYWLQHNYQAKTAQTTKFITKANPKGQKTTFKLSDSTSVILNAKSAIKFPEVFSDEEKVVYLEGDAFFEVANDQSRPFKVINGRVIIRVLGTSFYVKGDSIRREVQVALVHGKISVTDDKGYSAVLLPGEMLNYSPEDIEKTAFDYDQIIGWVHNKLVFHNATSREVINRLESWYGVDLIADEPIFEGRYSGSFENETLKNVLDDIKFTSSFQYRIDDKKVIIKHAKP
ncbi:DUF4974 domain-containing protein [Fulvivirgaceae bacterium BMA12]|uniref:DUF4974 domain-containing protein n=1 Tax=Agaribacillus aureus TaxID=3051825 RepID=A0ABT8LFT8_9BACT|nr:DUF4974 domain-containing protein [Fulvivirgaceae bacterium BMA12]